ncbi:glycosyltransferase [Mesorhizobium sp. CAU 1732]|uniref:glycosyltransferase n=1 Tax=Mesorhizobium sp. CAU 1732 TaxID=3140358 RepID=UPI00326172E2
MAHSTARGEGMTISVVIAVRNGERFIAETVRSVLAQGACVREVIVVDDGSVDQSVDEALSHGDPRVRVLTNPGRGVSAARNHGVADAHGDWLYFIDADDLVRPGALDALLDASEQAPRAGLIYGDYDRIRQDGAPIGRRKHFMPYRAKPSGDVLEAIVQKNCMVLGAQIVRRAVYNGCDGFDERLRVAEDWHFWCKAAAVTEFLFVPDLCVMSYRVHEASAIHSRPLPFEALAPAIDTVYRDASILRRLDPAQVPRFKRRAEAAQLSYVASVAVRRRTYAAGLSMMVRSIRRDPSQGPRTLAQFAGAFVGL